MCKFAINWTASPRRRTVLQRQARYMTNNTRDIIHNKGVRQIEYGILDNIQIGIQHMNARRQENSNVHYNWWLQHSIKTHISYSFKYFNLHECYWRYIPYFFVVLAVQSIVWCTSNDPNPRYIFPGGRSMKTYPIPMFLHIATRVWGQHSHT